MFSSGNDNGEANRADRDALPIGLIPLPKAMASLDVLGARWLTDLLQASAPRVVVERVTVTKVITGRITRVHARIALNAVGRAMGLPNAIWVKANWSDIAEVRRLGVVEARFYRHIRDTIPSLAPRALFAGWEEHAAGQSLIVLEDLAAAPGRFGEEAGTLSVAQAVDGLSGLASLHASLWESPRLDRYVWLARSMSPGSADADPLTASAAPPVTGPDWLHGSPERLIRLYNSFVAQERRAGGPTCLLHGAASHANSFVRPDGERLWIDWRHVRKGPPWRDVATFLIGALAPEDRRGAERDLIDHYRAELAARGVPDVPGFDALWDGYRRWPLFMIAARLSGPRRPDDAYGARVYRAAEELGTIELIERQERG